jgi:hypothetical protein
LSGADFRRLLPVCCPRWQRGRPVGSCSKRWSQSRQPPAFDRNVTHSLPWNSFGNRSQPTATGFHLFEPFRRRCVCHRLPPVATAGLHKGSILSCPRRLHSAAGVACGSLAGYVRTARTRCQRMVRLSSRRSSLRRARSRGLP